MDEPNTPRPGSADGDSPQVDAHRMPGWVKGFVVAGIAAVLVIALLAVIGGDHGPARHLPAGDQVEAPADHDPPVDQG